jgi:hypothetical protein
MGEPRDSDDSIQWVNAGITIAGMTAAVVVVWMCDRAYRRWLRENHLLAGHRARMVRFKTGYRSKRIDVTDVAQLVADVLVEVARAR